MDQTNTREATIDDFNTGRSGFNLADDNVIIKGDVYNVSSASKDKSNKGAVPLDMRPPSVTDTPYAFSLGPGESVYTKQADAIVDAFAKQAYLEQINETIGDAAASNPFLRMLKPRESSIVKKVEPPKQFETAKTILSPVDSSLGTSSNAGLSIQEQNERKFGATFMGGNTYVLDESPFKPSQSTPKSRRK